jgi:hypothetical protein
MNPYISREGDDQAPHDEPLVECPMCHSRVPESKLGWHIGRKLCLDCLAAWFDDEETEDDR